MPFGSCPELHRKLNPKPERKTGAGTTAVVVLSLPSLRLQAQKAVAITFRAAQHTVSNAILHCYSDIVTIKTEGYK